MSQPRAYEQQLSRSLKVLSNIAITLSAVTPGSSVFIIVPAILLTAGTGAFLALLLAALIGVFMAFCWAELSAAFPIAGGDYAIVWHACRGRAKPLAAPLSVLTFALMLASIAFIPAVIALGTAQYLGVLWTLDARWVGAAVIALAAAVAVLGIRLNAWITGAFLVVELLALAVLTALGLLHLDAGRLPLLLTDWQIGNAAGGLEPVSLDAILAATAVALFAYNGYGGAIFFAEETQGSSRGIATAILWSLAITVVAEAVPIAAVLLGTPDLVAATTRESLMNDFLLATASPALNAAVSLGVALAIFNAVIAILLQYGRVLYASGRDRAWPGPLSEWLATIAPRFETPWFATLLVAAVAAALCLAVPLGTLIALTGASLVLNYACVALAALIGRASGATASSPYRMPAWPLPPLAALGALLYVTAQQSAQALCVTGATMALGLLYWAAVIRPDRGRWELREAVLDSAPPAAGAQKSA